MQFISERLSIHADVAWRGITNTLSPKTLKSGCHWLPTLCCREHRSWWEAQGPPCPWPYLLHMIWWVLQRVSFPSGPYQAEEARQRRRWRTAQVSDSHWCDDECGEMWSGSGREIRKKKENIQTSSYGYWKRQDHDIGTARNKTNATTTLLQLLQPCRIFIKLHLGTKG